MAGHLILSDEDVTSELQGLWRRVNTLQHYKVGRLGAGGLWEGWELKGCGKVGSWRVGRVDQDRQGLPAVVSRSQMEQRWPLSPASPSIFLGKTRIMSLENVSISSSSSPLPSAPSPPPSDSLLSSLLPPLPHCNSLHLYCSVLGSREGRFFGLRWG